MDVVIEVRDARIPASTSHPQVCLIHPVEPYFHWLAFVAIPHQSMCWLWLWNFLLKRRKVVSYLCIRSCCICNIYCFTFFIVEVFRFAVKLSHWTIIAFYDNLWWIDVWCFPDILPWGELWTPHSVPEMQNIRHVILNLKKIMIIC